MYNPFKRNKLAPATPAPVNDVEELLKAALTADGTVICAVHSGEIEDPTPTLELFGKQPSATSREDVDYIPLLNADVDVDYIPLLNGYAGVDYIPLLNGYAMEWVDSCNVKQVVFFNRRTAWVWDGNMNIPEADFLSTTITPYIFDVAEQAIRDEEAAQAELDRIAELERIKSRLNIGQDCLK